MSLLKEDGTTPGNSRKINVIAWPVERLPEGIGLSIKDGWYFGIGLGLALTVAVPLILLLSGLIIVVILAIFGSIG